MNSRQALSKLKSLGSAQTRKTYGRHGVTGEMFGVKYGDMAKLVRQIKTDHDLALELWDSGNHDARILATMIADPDRLTSKVLNAWIKDIDNHVLSHALAKIAARGPAGRKQMKKWMGARGEWPAATGWNMLSSIASEPDALTRADCGDLLGDDRAEDPLEQEPGQVLDEHGDDRDGRLRTGPREGSDQGGRPHRPGRGRPRADELSDAARRSLPSARPRPTTGPSWPRRPRRKRRARNRNLRTVPSL